MRLISVMFICMVVAAAPPAPFNTSFRIEIDWNTGVPLPTYNFSVRQVAAIYWPIDGHIYAYADIVPFNDPFYPASYSSSIGVYSSPDGFSRWIYHGLVLEAGAAGSWDAGGVATPGATVTRLGPIPGVLLSFAAESEAGGNGTRGIGLAGATTPLGPFSKVNQPGIGLYGVCHSDDSQLLVRPETDPTHVSVYHRLRHSSDDCGIEAFNCSVNDCVRHKASVDGGATWSVGTTVRTANASGFYSSAKLQEVFAMKWEQDGERRLVMVSDFHGLPCAGGEHCLVVKLSTDGDTFWPAVPPTLQGSVFQPSVAPSDLAADPGRPQIVLIPDVEGRIQSMGVARFTNNSSPGGGAPPQDRAYTHFVYKVTRFG